MLIGSLLAHWMTRWLDHQRRRRNSRHRRDAHAAALRQIARLPDYLRRDIAFPNNAATSQKQMNAIKNIRLIDELDGRITSLPIGPDRKG